ncbi:hypothetical protein [Clostridium beijerinckii]|uniref:hypothetical protein n=1 Tax=Clostridium beijerinckii TaxID=1520 RepID=UPI00098C61C3|nr:hypothetical protein [Clostridium beijerinckii]NOW06116.1 hypothetical protein [Clostridium beijerinckii]NRT79282.1 hypothetical protein [Clostridium beijerinckii]NYC00741.1 hypothetical protein [Clostridium beijerinckii]OOM43816.1 hypothetical protein CBEIJ_38130 [Clostridium beijerinckii]
MKGNVANAKAETKFSAYDDGKIDSQVRICRKQKNQELRFKERYESRSRCRGKWGNGDVEAYLKVGKDEASGK